MDSCIFCQIVNKQAPSWKVMESDMAYAFLDIHPVNRYHTLVVPKHHFENIFDIPEKELNEVMSLLKKVTTMYREKLSINHLQVINSSGAEAQQDVFHIHFHIIPRYRGDGQNIRWNTYPEMRSQFDKMLERLK